MSDFRSVFPAVGPRGAVTSATLVSCAIPGVFTATVALGGGGGMYMSDASKDVTVDCCPEMSASSFSLLAATSDALIGPSAGAWAGAGGSDATAAVTAPAATSALAMSAEAEAGGTVERMEGSDGREEYESEPDGPGA